LKYSLYEMVINIKFGTFIIIIIVNALSSTVFRGLKTKLKKKNNIVILHLDIRACDWPLLNVIHPLLCLLGLP